MNIYYLALSLITLFSVSCNAEPESEIMLGKTSLKIVQGDITEQKVEVIVNAANERLEGGAGVCGAIFKAAGADALQKACNRHPAYDGIRCITGQAKITPSYNLTSRGIKYIIHAVGPDCRVIKETSERTRLLTAAYTNSLQLATDKRCKSIAFPFISAAIYACPKDLAAKTAFESIKQFVMTHKSTIEEIRFVLFSPEDFDFCKTTLQNQSQEPEQQSGTWFSTAKNAWQNVVAYFSAKKV